jgi:hypothetical protein
MNKKKQDNDQPVNHVRDCVFLQLQGTYYVFE